MDVRDGCEDAVVAVPRTAIGTAHVKKRFQIAH